MHTAFIQFVREYFQRPNGPVPLHEARTGEEELQQLQACLASGQLSSVGPLVHDFKNQIAEYLQIPYAVATSSGTAALHLALVTAVCSRENWSLPPPLPSWPPVMPSATVGPNRCL